MTTQGIDAHSGETRRGSIGNADESPVGRQADAPNTVAQREAIARDDLRDRVVQLAFDTLRDAAGRPLLCHHRIWDALGDAMLDLFLPLTGGGGLRAALVEAEEIISLLRPQIPLHVQRNIGDHLDQHKAKAGAALSTPPSTAEGDARTIIQDAIRRAIDGTDHVSGATDTILAALSKSPSTGDVGGLREQLRTEIINTPETADFMAGVPLEAAHQRERWGADHDAGKNPFDWFWLIGYLAQKAASSAVAGDTDKAKHHTISTAGALANWHAALDGLTDMRPGIGPGNGGDKPGSAYAKASALQSGKDIG